MSLISRGQTIFQQASYLSEEQFYHALKDCPFLEQAGDHIIKELISKSPKRILKQNDYLYHSGEYGHSLFVLVSGSASILKNSDHHQAIEHRLITTLEYPGSYFGEDVMMGEVKREFSCIVSSKELVCIELEKSRLERANVLSNGMILNELKKLSEENLIEGFLTTHIHLNQLSHQAKRKLKRGVKLLQLNRLEDFDLSTAASSMLCVKQGVLKLIRKSSSNESILSYFNTGDLLNLQLLKATKEGSYFMRPMELSQIFILNSQVYETLSQKDQEIIRSFEFLPKDRLDTVKSNSTVLGFVEDMVQEGAHQGLSLLTINLDHCVRCGNCVSACESRHGHSKFTRKGKALVRRKDMEKAGDYQKLLIPSSCRHCTNPECMIGCPTGAIHRAPGGEVDIKDFCIGCGSCANRCPYGNITMVMRDEEEIDAGKSELLASKCNLCSGYEEPNCVNNCPTGAILRVEPSSYFQELVDVLGQGGGQNQLKQNATEHIIPKDIYLLPLLSLLLILIGSWATYAHYTIIWEGVGFAFGIVSALFMFLSIFLAARRRMAGFKKQIWSLRFWTNAHFYFGALAFIFMLLHTKGSSGRALTSLLFYTTNLEMLLGLFGLWLYKRLLPRALSNLEIRSQIEDDAIIELKEIGKKLSNLLNDHQILAISPTISVLVPGLIQLLSKNYQHDFYQRKISSGIKESFKEKDQLIELLLSQAEVKCTLFLYQLRRVWLFTHLGMSAVVISFVILHIYSIIKSLI